MGYRHPGVAPLGPEPCPRRGKDYSAVFHAFWEVITLLWGLDFYHPPTSSSLTRSRANLLFPGLNQGPIDLTRLPMAEPWPEGNFAPLSLTPTFTPWQFCAYLQTFSPSGCTFCVTNPFLKHFVIFCYLFR